MIARTNIYKEGTPLLVPILIPSLEIVKTVHKYVDFLSVIELIDTCYMHQKEQDILKEKNIHEPQSLLTFDDILLKFKSLKSNISLYDDFYTLDILQKLQLNPLIYFNT